MLANRLDKSDNIIHTTRSSVQQTGIQHYTNYTTYTATNMKLQTVTEFLLVTLTPLAGICLCTIGPTPELILGKLNITKII